MQKSQPKKRLRNRVSTLFEKRAWNRGFKAVAGIDEAGRGPLAGPVVAAACLLPRPFVLKGINDSKKLTPLQRFDLYEKLIAAEGVHLGIGIVDALRIDQINILQATFEAMLMALHNLQQKPDYVLVDGSMIPSFDIPHEAVVEGDEQSLSIAAASIVAKVTRDRMMMRYHEEWPDYGFDQHKGYGTPYHLEQIQKHGPSPIHRKTFSGVLVEAC